MSGGGAGGHHHGPIRIARPVIPDMDSHNGLRGAAAVWVALFHLVGCMQVGGIDFLGTTLMPLFFIISGFSLAVVYGGKPWRVLGGGTNSQQKAWGADITHATAAAAEGGPIPPQEEDDVELQPPSSVTSVSSSASCSSQLSDIYSPSSFPSHAAILKQHERVPEEDCLPFDWKGFYWNRFFRIMPSYYLCNLLSVPTCMAGYTAVPPIIMGQALITSLIPVNTLLNAGFGFPLDDPSWFISTMVWLWLAFPFWLTRAQRLTDDQLVRRIVGWYYLQLALLLGLYHGLAMVPVKSLFWDPGTASGWNPLSRFPLMLMGMDAGILCLRHPTGPLPWPHAILRFFPLPFISRSRSKAGSAVEETRLWAYLADYQSIQLLTLTLIMVAIGLYRRFVLSIVFGANMNAHIWLTAIVAYAHLEVMVALTRDGGGKSLASRALRTPLAQWLGKISAALYLFHMVAKCYFMWALHGTLQWPMDDCMKFPEQEQRVKCMQHFMDVLVARVMPNWALPFVFVLAVAGAVIIHYCVEEPIRRWLKKGKPASSSAQATAVTTATLEPAVPEELQTLKSS